VFSHEDEAYIHTLVQCNGDTNEEHANDDNENHLIQCSLLNALFPNVVLYTGLFGTPSITKINNVLDKSLCDTLKAHCIHIKHALECLTHAKS